MSTTTFTDPVERVQQLRQGPFLAHCPDDDLLQLALASRILTFEPHQILVKDGDAADDLLILLEGHADVIKQDCAGASAHVIAQVKAGDVVGEMALLDEGPRSATVEAVTSVKALAIPLVSIRQLGQSNPAVTRALLSLASVLVNRMRHANQSVVEGLQHSLEQAHMRATMGRFTFMLMVTYSLYTWILGTATQMKEALGRSEFVTVPVIIATTLILIWFMRTTGYGPAFFGVNLVRWRRQLLESLGLTGLLMVMWLGIKWGRLTPVPSMQGLPLIQMAGGGTANTPAAQFQPLLTLAYVIFAPFQELIYRGALQGTMSHFLTGPRRHLLSILGSNIIFSAAHLYISPGLSVTAFFVGLFWGWMYARHKSLLGVSLSHVLLGFWAFEVVDLGVLE